MPTIGFISDIHANAHALDAVLSDAECVGLDALVCLGDVVGYGPDPDHCLDRVAAVCDMMIRGNHDEVLIRQELQEEFHPRARASVLDTLTRVSPGHLMLIQAMRPRAEIEGVALTHGSFGPRPYEYLYDAPAAQRAFAGFDAVVGVVGHTHLPSMFVQPEDPRAACQAYALPLGVEVELPPDSRVILNPGSVGQPRDRNPDAAWGVLRTERRTFEVRRVAYDVDAVQRQIEARGLPYFHALRLRAGV